MRCKHRDQHKDPHYQEYKRKWARERHAKCLAAGVCIQCWKNPAKQGVTRCETCHAKHLAKGTRAAARVIAKGLPHPATARHRLNRQDAIAYYGGKCCRCDETEYQFLTLDHIADDGAEHRRNQRSARRLGEWAKSRGYPPVLQVLCWNCNYLKSLKQSNDPNYIRYRDKLRAELQAAYGETCVCCGEARHEVLTVDHIHGGGCAERRRLGMKSGTNFYKRLRKSGFPSGYQTLCFNCNCGRALNGGVCPHKSGPPHQS